MMMISNRQLGWAYGRLVAMMLAGLVASLGCDNTALVGAQDAGSPSKGTPNGGATGAAGATGTTTTGIAGATGDDTSSGTTSDDASSPFMPYEGGVSTTDDGGVADDGQGPSHVSGPWVFYDAPWKGQRTIFAGHPDGTDVTQVTTILANCQEPAISPDGKTLAFSSDMQGAALQIFVVDVPNDVTYGYRRVTTDDGGATQPSWSPDGKQLTYREGTALGSAIDVIGVDGTGKKQIATGTANQGNSVANPVFASATQVMFDRLNQMHVVDVTSMAETTIIPGYTGEVSHPAMSPDGQSFAYTIGCEDELLSIWSAPISGTTDLCGAGRLTSHTVGNSQSAAFSATGVLAFEHGASPSRIALLGSDGSATDITSGPDDRNPAWSPASTVLTVP